MYEFNKTEGSDMMETMIFNWKNVCDQLVSNPNPTCSSYMEEKAALMKIEKNVYHRKTASPVVITEVYTCTLQSRDIMSLEF